MPTLEQITDPVFSIDSNRSLHREFVPFNEELTAELFADEINSGRMSVKNAYNNFWSFEIDTTFWGVRGRVLLPDWKPILISLSRLLNDSKSKELFDIVRKTDGKTHMNIKFDPYIDNFDFSYELATSKYMKEKVGKPLAKELLKLSSDLLGRERPLVKYYNYESNISSVLSKLNQVGYYDKSLLEVLGTFKSHIEDLCPTEDIMPLLNNPDYSTMHDTLIDILSRRGVYHEKMERLLENKDMRCYAMKALLRLKKYDKLTEYLEDEDRFIWELAVEAIVMKGDMEKTMKLINEDVKKGWCTRGSSALYHLGQIKKFDVLRQLLKSNNSEVRHISADTLYRASEFDGLDELINDKQNILHLIGLASSIRLKKFHMAICDFSYATRDELDLALNIYYLLERTDVLECFLNDPLDPSSADIAASYLYRLGKFDMIKKKTDNPWEDISMTAVSALEKDRDYFDLLQLIKKDDPNTARHALESLIRINPIDCIELIRDNLDSIPIYAKNRLFVALQPKGYIAPDIEAKLKR
jgi:hypothetical protein